MARHDVCGNDYDKALIFRCAHCAEKTGSRPVHP